MTACLLDGLSAPTENTQRQSNAQAIHRAISSNGRQTDELKDSLVDLADDCHNKCSDTTAECSDIEWTD